MSGQLIHRFQVMCSWPNCGYVTGTFDEAQKARDMFAVHERDKHPVDTDGKAPWNRRSK